MPSSRTDNNGTSARTDEGRLSSSRIIEIGLMFTSLSPLLALALLILSWLAGTADACPLWAEDSRAPGPASFTPSRPIVLRCLRWKGADRHSIVIACSYPENAHLAPHSPRHITNPVTPINRSKEVICICICTLKYLQQLLQPDAYSQLLL